MGQGLSDDGHQTRAGARGNRRCHTSNTPPTQWRSGKQAAKEQFIFGNICHKNNIETRYKYSPSEKCFWGFDQETI